jgi:1-acyl-sn-glycerol-3-phosphate acyltransferase
MGGEYQVVQQSNKPKSFIARLFWRLIVWWFKRNHWTAIGSAPEPRRFVVIAAPHTSNWDFLYFIGAAHGVGANLSFMGKKGLFRWPFGQMMRDMGGIPVDRNKSTNAVDAMIAEFAKRTEFMPTIAPEGTRGKVTKWKTGFYHIAVGAGVPLVCGFMDYKKKIAGLGMTFWPTGDYVADMKKLAAYYSQFTPKHPQQGTVDYGTV